MSPEQARGLELDFRSDLFSFGTLLYEMSTASRPFNGKTPLDTLGLVCSYYPPSIDSLVDCAPPRLVRLIEELMHKERARRPESAAAVARDLAQISADESSTGATGPSYQPRERVEIDRSQSTLLELPTESYDDHFQVGGASAASEAIPQPVAHTSISGSSEPTKHGLSRVVALTVALAILVTLVWLSPAFDRQKERVGPEPLPTVQELLEQGRGLLATYHRPKDLAASIEVFHSVLEQEPESAIAYALLSRAYWRRYFIENSDPIWLDQALSHGRKAVDLNPYLSDARASLVLALALRGRLDEAETELEGALALDPTNAYLYRAKAEIHFRRGRLDEAEAAGRKALELSPDEFELYDFVGSKLAKLGRLDEAAQLFERSIELAPDSFAAYRNLGGVRYRQGRSEEAAKWIQKALEIRPDKTLFSSLGVIYFDQGLYRDAVAVFEQAFETTGGAGSYQAWANLADAHRWIPGHETQAHDAYGQAVRLLRERGFQDPENQTRLALYLAKQGEHEEATRELEAIDESTIQEVGSWYRLAVAWEVLGNRSKALKSLAVALEKGYPLAMVRRDPELTDLRADSEYHRHLARFLPQTR